MGSRHGDGRQAEEVERRRPVRRRRTPTPRRRGACGHGRERLRPRGRGSRDRPPRRGAARAPSRRGAGPGHGETSKKRRTRPRNRPHVFVGKKGVSETTREEAAMSIYYDPFNLLDELRGQMLSGGRQPSSFPMDAYRRGDDFFVHLDLPGVQPDTIDISVENQVLTVEAERRFEQREGDQFLVAERPQGRFSRQLRLNETIDTENIARA